MISLEIKTIKINLLLLVMLPLILLFTMKILSYRFPDREIDFIEKVEIGAMDH